MRKRAISAVLAASMMLSVVPAPAFAAGNRAGGGTLPDEVTAQTLEQENANTEDNTTTKIDSTVQNTTFKNNITVSGGSVTNCIFDGTVTIEDQGVSATSFRSCTFNGPVIFKNINSRNGNVSSCTFNSTVEIKSYPQSYYSPNDNTFNDTVTINCSSFYPMGEHFKGSVTATGSGYFKQCVFDGDVSSSGVTFTNCAFLKDPSGISGISDISHITVSDELKGKLSFSPVNAYFTPVASNDIYYQKSIFIFGEIGQITHVNDKAIASASVQNQYSVDTSFSSCINIYCYNASDITLTHQEASLELGSNGYPKDADGNETDGTKDVTASTWEYSAKNKTLTLKSGDFTLENASVPYSKIIVSKGATLKDSALTGSFALTVQDGGKIESGTYKCGKIVNQGTINGGSFESSDQIMSMEGTINGGTFSAASGILSSSITGGIFLQKPGDVSTTDLVLADAENIKANGFAPAADGKIYLVASNSVEQTLELEYTGDAAKTYGWNVTVNGTSYGTLSAGESKPVFGTAQAAVSEDGTKLTITASSIPGQLSGQSIGLSAVHVPTYRAEDVTVKLGNQKISNKATLTYSPDLTEITVTDKSGESISGYTTKITDTKDNEVENFDGKPGKYKLIVSFNANDDHAASEITYTFGVKAADMNAELFEKYYTVELPGKNGEVAYDGEAHGVTVTKNADAPAALSDRIATIQYSNGISFPSYDAPTEPGTYSIYVSVYDNDYYNYYYPSNSAATFTITKGQLPDDEKNNLYFVEDNADQLASLDPTFDVSSFTGTDTYFYLDANGNKYTDLSSAPAGEYTKYRTFTSTKYDDVDVAFAKPEYSTTPDVENFAEADLRGITTANAAEKLAELNVALTEDSYISSDDVTITYYQVDEDGTETEVTGIPTEVGNYVFKVSVKESTGTIDGTDTPKYNAADLTSDKWAFTIEQGAEPDPDPVNPDGDGGAAVAAVIGTAAVGGAAYLVGTQVWLETNLPKGAAIPTNRQQLADLLWTTAGKPEPKSNVLYTDIAATAADSQKAARWCVEQGLLKDNGETFQPKAYTFRPQVIKAWTDLQAQLKADNK